MNDIVSKPMDPLYQRAMEFSKNMKALYHKMGISNVYVLQTIGKDGNVTDEKYGMNLMTDYGMSQYFVSRNSMPTNLYIGNGSGAFNHTSNVLQNAITTNASTLYDSEKVYSYPLYYDNVTGIVTCVCKYMTVYFDYTISGVLTDVDVSEYGIGTKYNELYTHSWVYNQLGQRDIITKKVNERLFITVYFCMSYSESMINNAWGDGRYIAITTMERFFNWPYQSSTSSYIPMGETNVKTFKRNDVSVNRTKSCTISTFLNNKITITTNMAEFTVTREQNTNNEYVDGVVNYTNGFVMVERFKLPTPIPFDVIVKPVSEYLEKKNCLSNSFGLQGYTPFTQVDISSSYTFSYSGNAYNDSDHYRHTSKWYNNTTFGPSFPVALWYTNNNTIQQMYVYINADTADPIVAIEGDLVTVYATDKYWDTSSWVQITNLSNVSPAQSQKKYWLTTSNSVNMKPKRQSYDLEYLDSLNNTTPSFNFDLSKMSDGLQHSVSCPANGWFAVANYVFVPSTYADYALTIGTINHRNYVNYELFGFENTAVFLDDGSGIVYLNITDTPVTSHVEPYSYTGTGITERRKSESLTGFIMIHTYAGNGEIIDIRNDGFVHRTTPESGIDACCVMGTDYYVYIDSSDQRLIHIKSLINDTTVQTFTISSDRPVATNVWGYKNFVYISDGSAYGYIGYISNGVMEQTTGFTQFTSSDHGYIKMTMLDECAIIYLTNYSSLTKAVVSEYSNPTVLKSLSGINPKGSSGGSYYVQLDLMKINTDTIVLLATSTYNTSSYDYYTWEVAFDFGQMLKTNTFDSTSYVIFNQPTSPMKRWVPYKEYIIWGNETFPIANLVTHQITGTTNTVTANNFYKHISNKQWTLEITNIGSYQGLPPGNVQ